MKIQNTNYIIMIFLIGILLGISLTLMSNGLKIIIFLSILPTILSLSLIYLLTFKTPRSNILQILEINYDKNLRCLRISMLNNHLLEDTDLFKGIYQTLMSSEEFKNFGYQKIIILSAVLANNKEFNLHSNILIDNESTFEDYYHYVSNELANYNNLQYGYHNEEVVRHNVLCWNVDNLKNLKIKQTHNALTATPKTINGFQSVRSFHSSANLLNKKIFYNTNFYKGLINPLSILNKNGELKQKHSKSFFTMDIETIEINNIQVPIAISSCGFHNHNIENLIFLIDHVLLLKDPHLAIKTLWNNYFTYLDMVIKSEILNNEKLVVFAHNLGNFDGYFLYKGLMMCYSPDHVTSIVDESNTFISIQHTDVPLIEWKDSLRIFPTSLNKLCKMFGVEGKLIPYQNEFNSIDFFNNPELLNLFIKYSLQDAKSLFQALYSAQFIYWDKFKIDLTSVYSTATLSLKIFRTNFQKEGIYILTSSIDSFIRNSYFGGGTDVYKAYGKNLHYYDVNSLYPFAMLNPMPHEVLNEGKMIDLTKRSLDSFFGFAFVKIVCPLDMERPVLPFHHEGKTIYPVGSWKGVYFSEELKAVQKLGYQITLIRGYEFSKFYPFNSYVQYFYEIKKNSTGVERDTAKLQLNNLYGYFGRKQIGLTTTNIHNDELSDILLSRIVKSITPINNEYSTVLTYSNVNYTMLQKLNNEFHTIGSEKHYIMSNVALASAVTAYARIVMIPFKIHPSTLYTDTDSAFTTKPIDPNLLGDELGLPLREKDELKGLVIEEAYFVAPKKYGYYLIDNGIKKEYSVFSGVPRNALTFEEVKSIFEGKTITKNISSRFFKSFTDLNIQIKDTHTSVLNKPHKQLINNVYLPPQINTGFHSIIKIYYNKFKNILSHVI